MAFNSYTHERNRKLLDTLRQAIFVLKLKEQNQLSPNDFTDKDVISKKNDLIKFLSALINIVYFLNQQSSDLNIDFAFMALGDRFILINPADVDDRIEQLNQLRSRLEGNESLSERDFQFLDRLQSYLQEDVAKDIKNLFRI